MSFLLLTFQAFGAKLNKTNKKQNQKTPVLSRIIVITLEPKDIVKCCLLHLHSETSLV